MDSKKQEWVDAYTESLDVPYCRLEPEGVKVDGYVSFNNIHSLSQAIILDDCAVEIPMHWYLYRDNSNPVCRLLSVIDDNGTKLVTYKWWRSSKQRWEYETETLQILSQFHF